MFISAMPRLTHLNARLTPEPVASNMHGFPQSFSYRARFASAHEDTRLWTVNRQITGRALTREQMDSSES